MLHGDFGISYTYRVPVGDLIAQRLGVSLPLALYALALTLIIAFPAGILAAARRNSSDRCHRHGRHPVRRRRAEFLVRHAAGLVFSITLRWFSAGGFPGWDNGLWDGLRSLTLPAIALALPQASILARVMRSSLLDTLDEDYIRTARAHGLSRAKTLWRTRCATR